MIIIYVIELPFCVKCGSEMPADAEFCPKCGRQAAVAPVAAERTHAREEKREKSEKDEKEEKREKDEKSGDRTGVLVGGLILIWLGVSLYLVQAHRFSWDQWWPYFIVGIGVILIVQAIVRYSTARYMRPAAGFLIGGVVLIVIGLAGVAGIKDWWPFLLIAIGVVVILAGVTARARTPRPDKQST